VIIINRLTPPEIDEARQAYSAYLREKSGRQD
jgi:hypothetical protein